MRVLAAIAIVLALAATFAIAGDFADGIKLYDDKDFAGAISAFRKAAEQGNAVAQGRLGLMYEKGQGVAQDFKQAAYWWEKVASQGEMVAQMKLASLYLEGKGVPKDYKQAMFWYEKAAAQGDALAQFILGLLYYNGQGVAQDYKEAVLWWEKAAAQGNADAQVALGLMYEEGKGVTQSNKQAAIWFQKAAAQGNADAKAKLAAATKALEGSALEAMKICERRATARLDDGVSPADVVATAVVAECREERNEYLKARNPDMGIAQLARLGQEVDRLSLPGTTRTVLEYRAAKRQAQEVEKKNEREKSQSRPARPKALEM